MPTYEYECEDCGPFSELRPMAEFDRAAALPRLRRSRRRAC